eukprot:TRINITY_DN10786_c0_g1_i6.p1 TRINITY_DN10786_c0_g1~~TRINITY_DN10786_c0_g1_i6.p1  ORF type:complete len:784 (+),score=104.40 TRINITY_DN10786_c0_g1_i6:45-2354(+)
MIEEVGTNKSSRALKYSFKDQSKAVFLKSLTYQWRQYKTNCCQLLVPVFLMVILFLIQILVTHFVQDQEGKYAAAVRRPPVDSLYFFLYNSTDDCEEFEPPRTDIANFLYSTDLGEAAEVGSYGSITQDEAFLPLPSSYNPNPVRSGVLGNATRNLGFFQAFKGETWVDRGNYQVFCFKRPFFLAPQFNRTDSKEDIDEILFNTWKTGNPYIGAYAFHDVDLVNGLFNFSIFYNLTISRGRELPLLINFIGNALWRTLRGNSSYDLLEFSGTRNFPTERQKNDFDLVSLISSDFYVYIFQLLFPVILAGIVKEKEEGLREIMKMMGLKVHIYWLVTYFFNYILYLVTVFLIIILGAAFRFRFFTINNFGVYFIFFLLWGHTLVALAILVSVFFTKSRTATVVGYVYIFASGLLASQLIANYFSNDKTPSGTLFGLSCVPPFALYRGLYELSSSVAFQREGLNFNNISEKSVHIDEVYGFLIVEWFICLLLGLYLDAVLPIGPGIKKHPLFFLSKKKKSETIQMEPKHLPPDVANEAARVRDSPNNGVRALGLRKVYPSVHGLPPKVAVHHLTMGVDSGECLGFLGPNGAGKSTTINMLCGYLTPTEGTVLVNGLNMKISTDEIHLQMGVCPQADTLWGCLTAREHLLFYGRLKNLKGKVLDEQVDYWLEQVKLTPAGDKISKEYSGGMKRRLSVAIALIGNPKIVLLDEPSTGLDPASRRALWDVIINYKKQCALLLTTHSMEEAEALCDRLAIFNHGKLRCIGAAAEV